MWLSKMIGKNTQTALAQRGVVTIAAKDGIETGSTVASRNIDVYAPYGYCASLPAGEDVFIMPCADRQAVIGSKSSAAALDSGEICISSLGGAAIKLKNDGSVVINSLTIDKNGKVSE